MEAVRFSTTDGLSLEGEIRRPEGRPRGSAVICHPHPEQGGSKDHPILWNIRNELVRRGFIVLSFNFRGVMGSEGEYGGGIGEVEDLRAAIGRIRQEAEGPTFVAGWSFGANVTLREAADDDRVGAFALVGIPLAESAAQLPPLPDRSALASLARPVLLVVGEADQFCSVPELRNLARRIPGAEVAVFPRTDHFFWRHEREVAETIGEFAERALLS